MKKVLVASAIALFAGMNAQETETVGFNMGDTFITGAVGFNSQTTGDVKSNTFTIAPSVGYFVTSNVALGARVGYINSTDKNTVANVELSNEVNTFAIGAFGRYYWMPASRFSIFGELAANYANAKNTVKAGSISTDSKANGFNVALAPGINYFLSPNFALEATWGIINYSSVKPDVDGAIATDNFGIGLDLNNISLGLVYKF
ncbi:porin family protein [Kaistella sp.]|uniref:porin family protein n=1 Tax=Kaistella sp. TaxID=2782235 RepID=UPI0035A00345